MVIQLLLQLFLLNSQYFIQFFFLQQVLFFTLLQFIFITLRLVLDLFFVLQQYYHYQFILTLLNFSSVINMQLVFLQEQVLFLPIQQQFFNYFFPYSNTIKQTHSKDYHIQINQKQQPYHFLQNLFLFNQNLLKY